MTWWFGRAGRAPLQRIAAQAQTRWMTEVHAVRDAERATKEHRQSRLPADRVWAAPDIIDIEAIAPTPLAGARSAPGLEGKVVVGYLGSLVDYEGIDLAAEGPRQLASVHPAPTG